MIDLDAIVLKQVSLTNNRNAHIFQSNFGSPSNKGKCILPAFKISETHSTFGEGEVVILSTNC